MRTITYLAPAAYAGTAGQSHAACGAAGLQADRPGAVPHTWLTVVALSLAFALAWPVAVLIAETEPAQPPFAQSIATASEPASAPFCSWRRSAYSRPTSTTIVVKPSSTTMQIATMMAIAPSSPLTRRIASAPFP